jgi:delta 1-pyrroline-5-carboxylate dehydrogenase
MGKPFKEGIGEVNKCIDLTNYYLKNSLKFLEDEQLESNF